MADLLAQSVSGQLLAVRAQYCLAHPKLCSIRMPGQALVLHKGGEVQDSSQVFGTRLLLPEAGSLLSEQCFSFGCDGQQI